MKRMIAAVMVGMIMACSMAGCGCSTEKGVDLAQVMTDIDTSYPNDMEDISTVDDLNKYYSIETADVKSFAAEINKSGIEEVVIVEAVSADAAKNVEEKLQQRYNSKKQQGASYSPEDLQVISNCSVKVNGNYVSMVVSSNASGMEEIFNNSVNG